MKCKMSWEVFGMGVVGCEFRFGKWAIENSGLLGFKRQKNGEIPCKILQ